MAKKDIIWTGTAFEGVDANELDSHDSTYFLNDQDLENHNTNPGAHQDIQNMIKNIDTTWDGIQNKPTEFTPSQHTHAKADITDFPTALPANGGNADTVDGKHSNEFIQMPRARMSVGDLNNANYPNAYRTSINDGSQIGLPVANWYHIDYFRHLDNNGYGTQVAYPLNHGGDVYWRWSSGTTWKAWKKMNDGGNASMLNGYTFEQLKNQIASSGDGMIVGSDNVKIVQNYVPCSLREVRIGKVFIPKDGSIKFTLTIKNSSGTQNRVSHGFYIVRHFGSDIRASDTDIYNVPIGTVVIGETIPSDIILKKTFNETMSVGSTIEKSLYLHLQKGFYYVNMESVIYTGFEYGFRIGYDEVSV